MGPLSTETTSRTTTTVTTSRTTTTVTTPLTTVAAIIATASVTTPSTARKSLRRTTSIRTTFADVIENYDDNDTESICDVFEVTNGTRSSTGTYFLSKEKAPAAPNLSVWKLEGKDRYIYNTGKNTSFIGWRIGRYSSLSTGKSYYKSSKSTLPKTK